MQHQSVQLVDPVAHVHVDHLEESVRPACPRQTEQREFSLVGDEFLSFDQTEPSHCYNPRGTALVDSFSVHERDGSIEERRDTQTEKIESQ